MQNILRWRCSRKPGIDDKSSATNVLQVTGMVNPDHSLLGSILHPQAKFGDMWRSAMIDAQSSYVDHHPRRSHRAMVIYSHPDRSV